METSAAVTFADDGAALVRDRLWRELERVVTDVGAVLGAHLRERPIVAWRDEAGGWLAVGRSRVRLELGPGEAPAVLGAGRETVRLAAFGESGAIAVLWADPVSGRWTSTESEGELLRLDDRAELERFFFAVMVDGSR